MTTIFISISLSDSSAHRSGCHRWHTCPSDTGSYTYVPKFEKFEDDEKPTYDRCPNGYNRNDEGICEKKIENNNNNRNDNKYGFKKKNYSPTCKNDLDSIDNTLGFDENDYLSDYKNDLYK